MARNDSPIEFMRQVPRAVWITQGMAVAAELGVADLLNAGPVPIEERARRADDAAAPVAAPCRENAAYRLLLRVGLVLGLLVGGGIAGFVATQMRTVRGCVMAAACGLVIFLIVFSLLGFIAEGCNDRK